MKKTIAVRRFEEIDLSSICANSSQTRDAVKSLSRQGYGVFASLEGSDKPSLVSLALSKNKEESGQFVALIDQHENGGPGSIKWLADDISIQGQLQPVRVRPSDEDGKYDLVFGCRRCLAKLYLCASEPKVPARITAEIVDEKQAKPNIFAAFGENVRKDPSPIDEARLFKKLQKVHGMTATEIADTSGLDVQVVRLRLKLNQLPADLQEKVHLGKVGVMAALNTLKKPGETKQAPEKKDTRRKMPSLKGAENLYKTLPEELPNEIRSLITEDVRKILAHWLDIEYKPISELYRVDSEQAPAPSDEAAA